MPPRRLPRLQTGSPGQGIIRVQSPYLALLALAAHGIAIGVLAPESADLARRLLIVGGYLLGLVFVWRNLQLRGMQLLGIGLLLNLLPVVANGGLMPVSPSTAEAAGLTDRPGAVALGDAIPHSKDVLLSPSETRLRPLTDTIVLPGWLPGRGAASAGDMVIAGGVAVIAASAAIGIAQHIRSTKQPPAQAAYAPRRM